MKDKTTMVNVITFFIKINEYFFEKLQDMEDF